MFYHLFHLSEDKATQAPLKLPLGFEKQGKEKLTITEIIIKLFSFLCKIYNIIIFFKLAPLSKVSQGKLVLGRFWHLKTIINN